MNTESETTDIYQVRYVAFLDIIGFRNLITTLTDNPREVLEIRDLLKVVQTPAPLSDEVFEASDFRSTSISDAVAISTASTADGLAHMFLNIELLTLQLLQRGYFVRGAIVKGRVFHDDRQVFGQGLIQAIDLETKIVCYPRVMLPQEIVLDVIRYLDERKRVDILKEKIRQAADGVRYLHILRIQSDRLKEFEGDKRATFLERLVRIRDIIQRRLEESFDEPKHFEKVQWFARYWNYAFQKVDGLSPIQGPGVSVTFSYAGGTRAPTK